MTEPEKPYLVEEKITITRAYNPNYGDQRVCNCGHPYERHFDSYEDMIACGCKYCACFEFNEDTHPRLDISHILEVLDYDPGFLNPHGGGDVDWWMNYIRSEINRCNAFWRSLIESYL